MITTASTYGVPSRCDVVVIGGGITGLSSALHCAEAGLSSVLLERGTLGSGATGRSAGAVLRIFLPDVRVMNRLLGDELTSDLFQLASIAQGELRSRLSIGPNIPSLRTGYLLTALNDKHAAALTDVKTFCQGLGLAGLRLVDGTELRKYVKSPAYTAAILDENGFTVAPAELLSVLCQQYANAQGIIAERTFAESIKRTGHRWLVTHAEGLTECQNVVIACNAYLNSTLCPAARAHIIEGTASALRTQPLTQEELESCLPHGTGGSDWRVESDYWAVLPDNSLMFGSGGSFLQRPLPTAALQRRLTFIFPTLASAAIAAHWSGKVAMTRNLLPHVARIEDGIWTAQGYNGTGLTLGYCAGREIARSIAEGKQDHGVLQRIPHQPFGRGATKAFQAFCFAGRLRLDDMAML